MPLKFICVFVYKNLHHDSHFLGLRPLKCHEYHGNST